MDYEQNQQNQQPVENQSKGLAVSSLVLGIVSIVMGCCIPFVGLILGVIGLVLGIMAYRKEKTGVAIAGIVLSVIGAVIAIIMWIINAALLAAADSVSEGAWEDLLSQMANS